MKKTGSYPRGVRISYVHSPLSLLPSRGSIFIDGQMTDMIFSNLIRANFSGALSPELAEKWEISPDGTEYTFHLRRNVAFHNGKPLTADDVIFTLKQLILDSRSPHDSSHTIAGSDNSFTGRTADVAGLRKIDAHTLKIILKQRFKYFLEFLSGEYAAILPENFAGKSPDDFAENPVGTGPFLLSRRSQQAANGGSFSVYHFQKNRHYFESTGNVDHVDWYFPGKEISTEAKLNFDIVYIEQKDVPAISASPEYKIINTSFSSLFFLILNPHENPDLARRENRQRIQYAVNREKLVSTVFDRDAMPAHSMIPFGLLGQNPGYRIDSRKGNRFPSAAEPQPLSFTVSTGDPLQGFKVLDFLHNDLKSFGIHLTVQTADDPDRFFSHTIYHTKNSLLIGGIPDYPTSYSFLSDLCETGGFCNLFQVPFPEAANAVRLLPFLDIVRETESLERINRQLEEEAIYIPLYYLSDWIAARFLIQKIDFKFGQVIDFSRMEVTDE